MADRDVQAPGQVAQQRHAEAEQSGCGEDCPRLGGDPDGPDVMRRQGRRERVGADDRHPTERHGEAELGELASEEASTRHLACDVQGPGQRGHDNKRGQRAENEAPAPYDEEPDPEQAHGDG